MHTQIRILLGTEALRSLMIVMPVIGIYFLEHGLSVQQIFLLQVIFSVAVVLFEVPSGYFADLFGRKRSIVMGTFLAVIGFALYYSVPGFTGFVLAELVLALYVSLLSGATQAFIYDTLVEHGKVDTYKKYAGYKLGVATLSGAIGAIAATGLLLFMPLKMLFLVNVLLLVCGLVGTLFLREPKYHEAREHVSMLEAIRFATRENKKLKTLNVFSGFLSASTLTIVWFSQPYWKEIGVPVAYFGILWAGLMLATSVASVCAQYVSGKIRFKTLFGVFGISIFVLYGMLGIGAGSMLTLLVFPGFWILRGLFAPLVSDYVNRETTSNMRATVLSINQLYTRVIFSALTPFLGWVADVWSFKAAFGASALTLGIATLITSIVFIRVMNGKKTEKSLAT